MAMDGNAGALVRARETAALRDAGWAEVPAARLAANIAEGYTVVALERPVNLGGQGRTGWWRIDPATGETIGVMDTGYHQDTSERELTDFQLNYMINYRHLYPPAQQARLAAEFARRQFWRETVPVLGLVALKIVATVAYFEFVD